MGTARPKGGNTYKFSTFDKANSKYLSGIPYWIFPWHMLEVIAFKALIFPFFRNPLLKKATRQWSGVVVIDFLSDFCFFQ
jgi:hypothetical protein